MLKNWSVGVLSWLISGFVVVQADDVPRIPPPIPPPEPSYHDALPQTSQIPRNQNSIKLTPIAAATSQAALAVADENNRPAEIDAARENDAQTLPDIVKCCPLDTITLGKAIDDVSLEGEVLPLPPNEAAKYMQSQGVEIDLPIAGVPSLHHPVAVFFQPLYFEDPNLERCGAGHGLATEVVSAVRFFGRAPLIPYMVGSQNPHECIPSLGSCSVCSRYGKSAYLAPMNARGAAFGAAAVIGLVFLLP